MNLLNDLAKILGATDPKNLLVVLDEKISTLKDAAAGKIPCPFCGKIHQFTVPTLEVPEYEMSTGSIGAYEFIPRTIRAMQLLPHNIPAAMGFMYDSRISFGFCASVEKDTPHFHVLTEENEWERWDIGQWLVVENDHGMPDFEVYVWADDYFRAQLREVSFVRNLQGSSFTDYRDDPIQTFGHSAQADLDAEQENEL